MEKQIRVFRSFEEADEYEDEYYANLTPEERLNIMCALCHHPDLPSMRPTNAEDAKERFRICKLSDLKEDQAED